MKSFSSKLFVSLMTFLLGVLLATICLVYQKPKEIKSSQAEVVKKETAPEPTKIIPTFSSSFNKENVSPYDIEDFINTNPQNNIAEVWEKLRINKANFGNSIKDSENDFFGYCGNCQAETFNLEFDGQPNSEVLLRIEDLGQEACRYLLFKWKNNNEWLLLGYFDHGFGRYEMPRHSNLLSDGKDWLVVRVQVGSGSGFALYYDRLFAVVNNKLMEILEFPADGHESNIIYTDRSIMAHIVDCKIEKNIATVEVEYSVTYSGHTDQVDNIELWSKKQKAVFRKSLDSKEAIFDSKKSDMSRREMASVYEFESTTAEEVVKYNFDELTKISIGKDKIKKQWLEHFLETCNPTRQTKILKNNLKK